MPPVVVDPSNVHAFASVGELERWLGEHHARRTELWILIHKKGSGLPSVTYAEALDVALAWGWIDGVRKSHDERSFLQRFTPRRRRSAWSQRNCEHVERLTRAGRMRAPGVAEVEAARADGRWAAAYAPQSTARVPDDLVAAIDAVPSARATFARLDATNRFALAYRLGRLKTAAGRERAIARYVQLLARGETLHPLAPGRAPARAEGAARGGEGARTKSPARASRSSRAKARPRRAGTARARTGR